MKKSSKTKIAGGNNKFILHILSVILGREKDLITKNDELMEELAVLKKQLQEAKADNTDREHELLRFACIYYVVLQFVKNRFTENRIDI